MDANYHLPVTQSVSDIEDGGGAWMNIREFNEMRRPFYGKSGLCQYCGTRFAPGQTVMIVRDYDGGPDGCSWHDWCAVCVGCASPDDLAAARRKAACKGCGQHMLVPHRVVRMNMRTGAYDAIAASTCSTRCEQRYRRRLRRQAKSSLACTVCNTAFRPARTDAKFCSNACRQWAYRRRRQVQSVTP
jgi:ribosomal protein L24E